MISEEALKAKLLAPLKRPAEQIIENNEENQNLLENSVNVIKMSLRDYVSNPTGKGSAYLGRRAYIKDALNKVFVKLLREHRKAFYAIPYLYPNGDILFYVKVPSEDYKNNKIAYDVLFMIKNNGRDRVALRSIEIFSNCPSFIFTYCYVYNKNGMLIERLKNRLPNTALTTPPVVRNPIESLGYEKSTYIAARYLIDGGCLTDEYIRRFGESISVSNESSIFSRIADPDLLVRIYQHAKYNERRTHRKPLSPGEKKNRDNQMKAYASREKKLMPKKSFIVHRTPRSKITARKAQKNFLSNK